MHTPRHLGLQAVTSGKPSTSLPPRVPDGDSAELADTSVSPITHSRRSPDAPRHDPIPGHDPPHLGSHLGDLAQLELAFECALKSFSMAFQPIVGALRHDVIAYEALLRPQSPQFSNPGIMLDAAERLHRLDRLGRAIRARVARDAQTAPFAGLLFVNLHALDLTDQSLASPYAPLARFRDRVVFEVTERASLAGIPHLKMRISQLREMGYRLAIDDLGAGHMRMSDFTLLDTDFVKLDMSLVRALDRNPIKQRLVAAISALCHDQGIRVVGEGVETAEERRILIELGCDLLQGFFIAKPAPPFCPVPPGP